MSSVKNTTSSIACEYFEPDSPTQQTTATKGAKVNADKQNN